MKALYIIALSIVIHPCILNAQGYLTERSNSKIIVKNTKVLEVYAFPLGDVTLLPGSPFYHAREKDAAYLLSIDPYRLLHRFYLNAHLPTRGDLYGGWENSGLSGHTLGHYLSACSMMYASTGDERFKTIVNIIVAELERCQQARKSGYIGAIPNEDTLFAKVARGDIKSGGFDLNGGWSPWYTVHKVMGGLADAYLYADSKKALTLLRGMGDWTGTIVNGLNESQLQKMLRCEYGGMNDILALLYAMTGERRYRDLSYKFYDDFVLSPLSKGIDPMPGKHSNTNVPKAIGSARQFELIGQPADSTIASFFWESMVHHHSYVIGGNSNYEYCGEPDKLNDRLSDNTCETCNTYNMLKLTRHLFTWKTDRRYGDYYERALYNHILASQHPETGMMTYFVPLRMGTQKTFSDPFHTFTCCVGSGMENHVKYNEGIYYEGADGSLFVNLFIPSTLKWRQKSLTLTQETKFPYDDNIHFSIQCKGAVNATLRIRKPSWASHGYHLTINKKSTKNIREENGYLIITRTWTASDQIELEFPMTLYTEAMPDNPQRVAFLYGPVVLAGQLGDSLPDPVYGVPVLLTQNKNIKDWIIPESKQALTFRTKGVGEPFDVSLKPFYNTYKNFYSVYWDFFTPEQWAAKKDAYEKEKAAQKEIERRTIDYFRIGEMQPERDHNLTASERSYVSDALGVNGREARADNYFAFEMKVDPKKGKGNSLVLVYIGDDKDRKFDIIVNERKLVTEELKGGATGKFYAKTYALPGELIEHAEKISVKIIANYQKTAGRVFGVRTIWE